jgi:hypothetical protein
MLMMMMFGMPLKNVVKLKVRLCFEVDKTWLFIYLDVRLIRDSATSVGKGFGYVLFQVCKIMFIYLFTRLFLGWSISCISIENGGKL